MEGHHNVTGFNCKRCELSDSADQMVACDVCQEWEHFQCAGVDDRIKDQSYVCTECSIKLSERGECTKHLKPSTAGKDQRSTKATASKAGSKSSKKVPPATPAVSITSSARVALEKQMQIIEEERQILERELKEQEDIRKQELEEEQRQLAKQRELMEKEKILRERKLRDSKLFQEKQQLIRQQSMEKKRELMKQLAESSSHRGSIVDSGPSSRKVEDWLNRQSQTDANTSGTDRANEPPGSARGLAAACSLRCKLHSATSQYASGDHRRSANGSASGNG
ncbi:ribonuclease Y 1-like [Topomyia yanbarensis]|uniref:ribonuclease Y 1-like n=1 Tax=Topomyia yanbarensis TaxID=2498891 RepID=UPI00273CE038|nr:ribonuclease Y 1-like [Topomyia yanbarensis]